MITAMATVTVQPQAAQSRHIVMVMEENTSYADVVRNSAWPNLNQLIGNGALATNYYANSHPSIGNYFMLTTGQLLTTDDSSTQVFNVDNIARRMLSSGATFRVYAEGITQGYTGGNTGLYLIRHNPFAMLSDVKRELSTALGVLDKDSGVAKRATFIVDPDGIIRFAYVTDMSVGRNPQEVLRVLDALQTDELCPCNWQKGEDVLQAA